MKTIMVLALALSLAGCATGPTVAPERQALADCLEQTPSQNCAAKVWHDKLERLRQRQQAVDSQRSI